MDGEFQGVGVVGAESEVALQVEGRHGVSGAAAVMLNVTAVGPLGPGFLTVYPCGAQRPLSSSVNYQAGQVVPNAVLAKVGADGKVCIWTKAATHILADVTAYIPGESNGTGPGGPTVPGGPNGPGDGDYGGSETWTMLGFDHHDVVATPDGTVHMVFSRRNVESELTEFWYAQCYEGCHDSANWLGGPLVDADDWDYLSFETGIAVDTTGRVHVLISGDDFGFGDPTPWNNFYATCADNCSSMANWSGDGVDALWEASFGDDAAYYGNPAANALMVQPDGTVAFMAYGEGATLFASCDANCTSAANWSAGRVDGDDDWGLIDAVVGADGTYHMIFDGDYTEEGDMLVRYARCSASCTILENWQKSAQGFMMYSNPYYSHLAVTDSGRVFVGYPQSDLPSTAEDEGELYVLATCAGSGCVDLATWSTFSLTGADQEMEGYEGSDIATYGDSVLLTTGMSIDDIWGYSCDAGCESEANWSDAVLVDSANFIEAELPAVTMGPLCNPAYSSFWYPGSPAAAVGPSGVVVVHNPNTLYKCTSDGSVHDGPTVARVISTF